MRMGHRRCEGSRVSEGGRITGEGGVQIGVPAPGLRQGHREPALDPIPKRTTGKFDSHMHLSQPNASITKL